MLDKNIKDLKILFSQETIEARTKELAEQINEEFGLEETLTLVCVLKGSSMFFCDLAKYLKMPTHACMNGNSIISNDKTEIAA